jgi:D-aminopeptidase
VPSADLTVVVIANLGSIDPWRLAQRIAADALDGDKRLKPALEPVTQDEIERSPVPGSTRPSRRCSTWPGRTARRR